MTTIGLQANQQQCWRITDPVVGLETTSHHSTVRRNDDSQSCQAAAGKGMHYFFQVMKKRISMHCRSDYIDKRGELNSLLLVGKQKSEIDMN